MLFFTIINIMQFHYKKVLEIHKNAKKMKITANPNPCTTAILFDYSSLYTTEIF